MDAAEWDARYAQHDLVWGAGPNSLGVEKNVLRQVKNPEGERAAIDPLVRVRRAPDGPAA